MNNKGKVLSISLTVLIWIIIIYVAVGLFSGIKQTYDYYDDFLQTKELMKLSVEVIDGSNYFYTEEVANYLKNPQVTKNKKLMSELEVKENLTDENFMLKAYSAFRNTPPKFSIMHIDEKYSNQQDYNATIKFFNYAVLKVILLFVVMTLILCATLEYFYY